MFVEVPEKVLRERHPQLPVYKGTRQLKWGYGWYEEIKRMGLNDLIRLTPLGGIAPPTPEERISNIVGLYAGASPARNPNNVTISLLPIQGKNQRFTANTLPPEVAASYLEDNRAVNENGDVPWFEYTIRKVGDIVYRPFSPAQIGKVTAIEWQEIPHLTETCGEGKKVVTQICTVKWRTPKMQAKLGDKHESQNLQDYRELIEDHRRKAEKFQALADEVEKL